MRYVYSLVRFVPDPFRGELVNVGAIVGSEATGEWDIVQVSNMRRARAIQEHVSYVKAVADFMDHYGALLDPWSGSTGDGEDSDPAEGGGFMPTEGWLTEMYATNRSVVQLSE